MANNLDNLFLARLAQFDALHSTQVVGGVGGGAPVGEIIEILPASRHDAEFTDDQGNARTYPAVSLGNGSKIGYSALMGEAGLWSDDWRFNSVFDIDTCPESPTETERADMFHVVRKNADKVETRRLSDFFSSVFGLTKDDENNPSTIVYAVCVGKATRSRGEGANQYQKTVRVWLFGRERALLEKRFKKFQGNVLKQFAEQQAANNGTDATDTANNGTDAQA